MRRPLPRRVARPAPAAGLLLPLLGAGCSMSLPPADLAAPAPIAGSPGTLVVDLVDGTSLADAREATGLDLRWVHPLSEDESLAQVDVPDVAAAAARLAGSPLVEVAEPPVAVEAYGLTYPDDPMWEKQWNLRRVNAKAGWRAGAGAGAIVAVVDTGVTVVPDLEGTRVLKGASFVPDEPTVDDANGHGTHVAGTIAQTTNNGLGVAGVAPEATILPIKTLSARGGGQSHWVAAAIDEAADQGADIINLSLGGPYSAVIANAVQKAQDRGVLVIAAAGNTGRQGVGYPAALPGVLAVSAVGPDDGLAFYSSWGEQVALSAPGGDTRVEDGGILQDTVSPGGGHAFKAFQGTSMATPHVSGAAAVLWQQAGGDADLVRQTLEASAIDLGAPGRDPEYGHGRIDIRKAITHLATRRQGLLFAVGGVAAFLLAGLGSTGRRRFSRAAVMGAAGAVAAGGLFFLPLLPVPPSRIVALLSRPLLQWPGALLPDALAANPIAISALVPVLLTFVLGPTRTLGPVVAGVSAGIGAHLLLAAGLGGLDVWPLSGWAESGWLALNGVIAVLCAIAVVGVGRIRDRAEE